MQFLIYNVEIECKYTDFLLGQMEEEILNLKEEVRRLNGELEEGKKKSEAYRKRVQEASEEETGKKRKLDEMVSILIVKQNC